MHIKYLVNIPNSNLYIYIYIFVFIKINIFTLIKFCDKVSKFQTKAIVKKEINISI